MSGGGEHIAGSPFSLHVLPEVASAKASTCDNCDQVFSAEGVRGNSSVRTLRLSVRYGGRMKQMRTYSEPDKTEPNRTE